MLSKNEHTARLQNPYKFMSGTFKRTDGGVINGTTRIPKTIAIIWGRVKEHPQAIPQALRFPTKYWSADQAYTWLCENKIVYTSFELAFNAALTPAANKVKPAHESETRGAISVDNLFAVMAKLEAEPWAMEPVRLESFFAHLATMSNKIHAADYQAANKYKVVSGAAHIAIRGILMKQVPAIFKWFGIEATSYIDITEQIKTAVGDKSVNNIVLDVDSPGGLVSGVIEAADAILAARALKPITAVVEDLAASGAYWLASQATQITASRTAQIGSIGVFSVYVDSSQVAKDRGYKVIVIRSGPHKGMGIPGAEISDKQIAAIQDIIDGLADKFVASVATGRKRKTADIKKAATGQLWLSDKAQELGLIDSVYSTSTEISNLIKGMTMEKNETNEIDAQVEVNKITKQVQGDERDRLSVLSAYFADDLTYAVKAFNKGKTLIEAKADYCDVLREKITAITKERDDAQAKLEANKPADKATGATPIEQSDSDEHEATGRDFISEAQQIAKEDKTTVTVAMKKLARKEPKLHQEYVKQCKKSA